MIETEKNWGIWVANILLALGIALFLSGIVFFFAFNWQNMLPLHKFAAIESGILFCILGAIFYSARSSFSALYLTGSSILVGVFLAVFGQIYQTGADAYQLFTAWAILILPWAVIAQFTPLWFIWLIIVNIALIFFLDNAPYFDIILLIFNTAVLLIKEYSHWLNARWARIAIVVFLLFIAFSPIDDFITYRLVDPSQLDAFVYYSAAVAMLTLGLLIYLYGFRLYDMWVVTLTSIECAILLCSVFMHILIRFNITDLLRYFIMLLLTSIIFTLTAYFLITLGKNRVSKG